jgi:hypothetical protein
LHLCRGLTGHISHIVGLTEIKWQRTHRTRSIPVEDSLEIVCICVEDSPGVDILTRTQRNQVTEDSLEIYACSSSMK